jgi:hypothetical protein
MSRSLLVLALTLATGCGGGWSTSSAQRALEVGSEAVQQTDEQLAPIVDAATARCDEAHEDREGFVECMEPYQPIRYGVGLSRHALRLGQAVVDGWRTGENEGASAWMPIAACIGHGLGEIASAVSLLELDLGETFTSVLGWIDAFGSLVAGVCPSEILGASHE